MNSIAMKEFHKKDPFSLVEKKNDLITKKIIIFAEKRTKLRGKAKRRILPQMDPIKVTLELKLSPHRPPFMITVFDLQVQPPEKVRPML